jgi:hypothetical protein
MIEWRKYLARFPGRYRQLLLPCALPLIALAIALPNLPGEENVYEAQLPTSGNLLHYFEPLVFNEVVDNGWVFYDIALLQESLRISLRKNERKHFIYFIAPQNPRHLSADCRQFFCIHIPILPPDGDPGFAAVATTMADTLQANLNAVQPLFGTSTRPTNLPAPWYELALLLLLGSLGVLLWRGLRIVIAARDWYAGLLVALFGTALRARLAWALRGPLHNNHHGAEELDFWLVPPESLFPSYYGRGHQAICDLFFIVLPRSFDIYMALAAVVGALSCVMAVLVVRALTGGKRWGWFAGVALALHPIATRCAASESTFNFAVLFLLLAMWGMLRYRRGGSIVHLLLGHAALMLAIVSHILTLSLLILPLLALLAPAGRPRSWPRLIAQLSAFTTSALLALPHAIYEWQADLVHAGTVADPQKLWQTVSGHGNLLLDPAESPWLIIVLMVATLLLLWRRQWRTFVLLIALALLAIPYYLVHASFSDLVRYQLFPATISVLLAGIGAELILDLLPSRWPRWLASGALALALIANIAMLTPTSNQHDAGSLEYATLQRWATDLPQSGLLVLPGELDGDIKFHSYFPALILQDQGLAYTIVTISEFEQMVADGSWPDEPVFYYEGVQMLWIRSTDDQRNPALHGLVTRLVTESEQIKRFAAPDDALVAPLTLPTVAHGHPTEFTALPANATITLYRLHP